MDLIVLEELTEDYLQPPHHSHHGSIVTGFAHRDQLRDLMPLSIIASPYRLPQGGNNAPRIARPGASVPHHTRRDGHHRETDIVAHGTR
ncbi:hypothetical protein ACFLV0_03370 [Chloroflexota bacterium]